MKIGYLRVSTEEQNVNRQIDALSPICDEIHIEKLSAVADTRPIFEHILNKLKKGDTLMVWSLDRAFRSVKDSLHYIDALKERGVKFQIVGFGVDITTADGRFAYTIVAAVAEHERNRLSERTKQGLAAARKRGVVLGPKRKLSDKQIKRAIKRIQNGEKVKDVASDYDVHPWTLRRNINRVRRLFTPNQFSQE